MICPHLVQRCEKKMVSFRVTEGSTGMSKAAHEPVHSVICVWAHAYEDVLVVNPTQSTSLSLISYAPKL